MTRPLSERRKDDRQEMTMRIEELVAKMGCRYKRLENDEYPGPDTVHIFIQAPRGLQVNVEFSKKSWNPNVHVLHWHMAHDSVATLNSSTFLGNVNPHHFRKATSVADGFDALCAELERCLGLAVSGKAYRESEALPELELA